jgi:glutamate-5-semialdehyde dehydrogenase
MAKAIRANANKLIAVNASEVAAAKSKALKDSFIDRLVLTTDRVEAMAKGLEDIAALPDPVGTTLSEWTRPNGMKISRVRVPGVIGIIFEPPQRHRCGCALHNPAMPPSCAAAPWFSVFRSLSALQKASKPLPASCSDPNSPTDRASVGEMLSVLAAPLTIVPRAADLVAGSGRSPGSRLQPSRRHLPCLCR